MMKYLFSAILLAALLSSCSSSRNLHVPDYTIVSDSETKVYRGPVTRSMIENDTAFGWFKENMQLGRADADALASFQKNGSRFSLLVFGATWCHDTQNLLPKFYRLVDKSGFPADKVDFVALDRKKTGPHALHTKWKITNVPTFIVLKNGKEVGRVVEYGASGNIEKELGDIMAAN